MIMTVSNRDSLGVHLEFDGPVFELIYQFMY